MYTVYGVLASRAFRVAWMLEEIGEAYEIAPVSAHSEGIRSVNPAGKIPAMVADGKVLTDSVAIMTFLGDRHGKLTFPAGSYERAAQDAMTFTLIDDFDAVLWSAGRLNKALPDDPAMVPVREALMALFAKNLGQLGKEFKGPFLMGETMTLADILATHCLNWATIARFPMENETMRNYARTMSKRDAYVRARARMEAAG